ncbi:MAG: 3'(2'),5'-bisphosphate nucleotidase CysQ [Alphaproteobacteria bacterium]
MTLHAFLDDSLPRLVSACFDAGDLILRHYKADLTPEVKADGSPSTVADKEAEAIVSATLSALPQVFPILAEEASEGTLPLQVSHETFWLLDPLDGTREFLSHTDEFTVNIGLVHQGDPIFGMVYIPVEGLLFFGRQGRGSCMMGRDGIATPLRASTRPLNQLRMITSRQTKASPQVFLDKIAPVARVTTELHAGSSLKFCRISQDQADIYPRPGRTMMWDTCAGDALLRAMGGMVMDAAGTPLRYDSKTLENPPFVALSAEVWGALG